MKLGFIGFGEAAFEMSNGLRQEGLGGVVAYDAMQNDPRFASQIGARVERAGVTLLGSPQEVADAVDVVFVAVPADHSVGAAETVAPFLRRGMLYVDLSASTPGNKKKIWEIVRPAGVDFADGAMLGALTVDHHKVPILASGNGARRFADGMSPYGMVIEALEGEPGDASAVKLIRSIFMKGVAALVLETLEAGVRYGVIDKVLPSLAGTFDTTPFASTVNRLATGTTVHAQRRGHELAGSIRMLEEAGIDAAMSEAAYQKHIDLAALGLRELLGGKTPATWQEAVDLIIRRREGKE